MNKVILTGNLCKDIELKMTTGGKEVITNAVAVQRDFKNEKGEYESDFINIAAFGASAAYLGRYAHKGDRVEIVGRWTVRKYQDRNGATQYANECIVESVKAFSRQPKEETQPYIPEAYTMQDENTDDLPF